MANGLPDGFSIDQPQGLPEGFSVDQPKSPSAPNKGKGWGDTWPAQVAKSVYHAVTLPGDVATGKFDTAPATQGQWSDEDEARRKLNDNAAMDRVDELKWLGSPMSPGIRAGAGWAGVPKTPPAPPSAIALENKNLAKEFDINLSRGQASKDLDAIRYEDMAARGAYGKPAQDKAAPFFDQQFQDMQAAGRGVSADLARASRQFPNPSEAATAVNSELGGAAANVQRLQQAAEQRAAQEANATRGAIDDQGRSLTDIVSEGRPGIENPREAGEIVGQTVRDKAALDRQNYKDRYKEAFALPGQFHAGAFEGIGQRIKGGLSLTENPVVIDDVTTPIASRAIQDLDGISSLIIQNRADPFGQPNPENITAINLRGVDQARKRLVSFYKSAKAKANAGGDASDLHAMSGMMNEFDDQVEKAISNGLFTGDPKALEAIQQARAAYSNYVKTYRPQGAGDDVGTAMRRIIDRKATPEEIANMIIGSGKIGNAGLPVRLADRLENVLGRDSDAWSAIRQGVWQKASQARNAAGEADPVKTATGILDLANSSLGRRMFSGEEIGAMRSHAQGIRNLDNVIASLPSTQRAAQVQNAYQKLFGGEGIGGAQETVFRRIMNGTASPEETAQTVFGAIGSGNPGNVNRMLNAIEKIAGKDSETMGAIRQGVWQKLTQTAEGKDQPGQQKIVQAVNEFLNGKGKTIAEQLYTPEERSLMDRYAKALRLTIIPKYARTNSDTAPAMLAAMRKYAGAVMASLGFVAEGGMLGGLSGYGVSKLLDKGAEKALEARAAHKVGKSLDELYATPPTPSRSYGPPLVRGTGLMESRQQ